MNVYLKNGLGANLTANWCNKDSWHHWHLSWPHNAAARRTQNSWRHKL